ncbi:MAG: NAD(P)-dependent oxidoreductase [Betaproteobacteria bacterium]
MAILITGGMGHVGYETVRQALVAGHEVVAQYRNVFREADARALSGSVTWIRCDLALPADVTALVEQGTIDGCIHTAAVPNDLVARKDPVGAVDANVGAVCSLLDAARRQGWRRFLNISTGSVFQNAIDPQQPIFEDAPPTVTNTYSTTKFAGELLTRLYQAQFNVPAATVRISWVYGPPLVPRARENPRGPIPLFLKLALAGKEVRESSGREFAASYTHVGDVAAGLLAAYTAKALRHDVYHLGSGRNFNTAEVAAAVRAAIPGAVIDVGPGTAPWTDDTRMRGPLAGSRLYQDTGFTPVHSLESGVAAFATWMRAHPDSYRD